LVAFNPLYFVAFLVILIVYLWTFYNLPILFVGVRDLRRSGKKRAKVSLKKSELPFFSIIVPVKDEESVVERLLKALLDSNYAKERREIVVVEDGSVDQTPEIVKNFERDFPGEIKVIRKRTSDGKPSALMEALKHVKGEIVGVFDADSVPERDALLRVAAHFRDGKVDAVQGRICGINSDQNMLTKFVAKEEDVRYQGYMRGKDVLGLFVPLNGSCYFVRRKVLEDVGGWNVDALSEDMELAARLVQKGHKIRYASDVCSWQEYPASLVGFFRQRVRWFRGTMEAGIRYGRLLRKPSLIRLDAEVTMGTPLVFFSFMMGYLVLLLGLLLPFKPDFVSLILADFTSVLTGVLLAVLGVVMIYASRPFRLRSLLWLPFIYIYWFVQNLVALYALLKIVFRKPRSWKKTLKTGETNGI
jgi:cellulose synthase/poly-beta-1,6-N-acetylglucosamine synthase-like glycosyltransferase